MQVPFSPLSSFVELTVMVLVKVFAKMGDLFHKSGWMCHSTQNILTVYVLEGHFYRNGLIMIQIESPKYHI